MDNNNLNLDDATINNIKNMMDKGDLSDVLSKVSPEMIQNFTSMLNSNSNNQSNEQSSSTSNTANNNNNSSNNNSQIPNFDLSQLDMKTVMKLTSAFGKMNNGDDSRSNLLKSLKPYLREEKRGKVDQYASLLNMTKIAELLKDDKKENQ